MLSFPLVSSLVAFYLIWHFKLYSRLYILSKWVKFYLYSNFQDIKSQSASQDPTMKKKQAKLIESRFKTFVFNSSFKEITESQIERKRETFQSLEATEQKALSPFVFSWVRGPTHSFTHSGRVHANKKTFE